jgi:hypothetical protein
MATTTSISTRVNAVRDPEFRRAIFVTMLASQSINNETQYQGCDLSLLKNAVKVWKIVEFSAKSGFLMVHASTPIVAGL